MRVLLDLPIVSGGVGRYGRDLSAALRGSGVDLRLVERPTVGPFDRAFTPWGRASVALRAQIHQVDLIHGLHLELPPSRKPRVVTVADLIPLQYPGSMPGSFKRLLFERILRRSVARASAIIVPSPRTRDALVAWGAPDTKIVVVPHGVGRIFEPLEQREREEARDRFAAGRCYVACIASERPHKNQAILPAVAELLAPHEVEVVVVGNHGRVEPGPTRPRIVPYLSDGDLREFYGGAETLLMPSFLEGFGLPAAEALACGTPVVCGEGLGALPYIAGGALRVDVSDPPAIAEACLSLIASDLRVELSEKGRRNVVLLSPDEMARQTVNVYSRVLG